MRRKDFKQHRRAMSEIVAKEIEGRFREEFPHYFWHDRYHFRPYAESIAQAYAVAEAVTNGLSPEKLSEEAITETIEVAGHISDQADNLVGFRKRNQGLVADIIDADLTLMARHTRIADMPDEEIRIFQEMGISMTRKKLKKHLKQVRAYAEIGLLSRWASQGEFRGAANVFREASTILESELKRRHSKTVEDKAGDKKDTRLGSNFFIGISLIITGAAGVVGDIIFAFGPTSLVHAPHGFNEATYTSITSGGAIALGGVPLLRQRD